MLRDILGRGILRQSETDVAVTATLNALAAGQFAKSYAPDVVALEPEGLRERVRAALEKSLQAYQS